MFLVFQRTKATPYASSSVEIQFSISYLFAQSLNVKQFYLTLSDATTPSQSGPRSDGNEGVLCIPQTPTGTSLSDCLVSYLGHSLGESYFSAEMQSVYSAPPH